jgi:hypothetical protein
MNRHTFLATGGAAAGSLALAQDKPKRVNRAFSRSCSPGSVPWIYRETPADV